MSLLLAMPSCWVLRVLAFVPSSDPPPLFSFIVPVAVEFCFLGGKDTNSVVCMKLLIYLLLAKMPPAFHWRFIGSVCLSFSFGKLA